MATVDCVHAVLNAVDSGVITAGGDDLGLKIHIRTKASLQLERAPIGSGIRGGLQAAFLKVDAATIEHKPAER